MSIDKTDLKIARHHQIAAATRYHHSEEDLDDYFASGDIRALQMHIYFRMRANEHYAAARRRMGITASDQLYS